MIPFLFKALDIACTLYVYRRGNHDPLQGAYPRRDPDGTKDARMCARDAVVYGKALANEIRGLL